MTLSGHTSTLPHLVVQGRVFEASLLQSGFGQKSQQTGPFMTEGVNCCTIDVRELVLSRRHLLRGLVSRAYYNQFRITGHLSAPCQHTVIASTLPHCQHKLSKT